MATEIRNNQPDEVQASSDGDRPLVKRHRVSTRIWHWINALTVFAMRDRSARTFMLYGTAVLGMAPPRLHAAHGRRCRRGI